ncbi:hypothetical protein ANAPC5_01344 [Anaplasma phagocytophilum]|nr:hypothetical protein ANAPC5_01344 [Anaplasma phagocytophilum]
MHPQIPDIATKSRSADIFKKRIRNYISSIYKILCIHAAGHFIVLEMYIFLVIFVLFLCFICIYTVCFLVRAAPL